MEIKKNEKCFIGMPSCGYGYESSKSCFVACPSHEKYTLKIDVIKDIIESRQYECHIALKRIDPGSFAFCTKICSKIIQSQFCIVLLDPSMDDNGIDYPNPNVHFEYGMMVSQNKYIIPLQDDRYDLAFNISPLDTVKYNDSNFKTKVTEAVDNAIKRFLDSTPSGQIPQGPEILTYYNFFDYSLSDVRITFYDLLFKFGSHLGFYLFDNKKNKYKFIGPFDYEDPKKIILHTKILIDNIITTHENLVLSTPEEKGKYDYLVNDISIDLIVPPFFDKNEILEKINAIINKKYHYNISIFYREDIKNKVESEYDSIGELKVIKPKK